MNIHKLFSTILIACISFGLYSQEELDVFFAKNDIDGNCYATCLIPPVFDTIREQVLVNPSYTRIDIFEPEFDTIEIEYTISPQQIKYEIIPAVYDTIKETVILKEAYNHLSIKKDTKEEETTCYEKFTESYETTPPTRRWNFYVKPNCVATEEDDCLEFMPGNFPPSYDSTTISVRTCEVKLATGETIEQEEMVLTRYALISPPQIKETVVPEVKKTIKRVVLSKEAVSGLTEIPAEYKTIYKLKLIKDGDKTQSLPVICDQLALSHLTQIQKTLKKQGYLKGKADGILDQRTKLAIIQFQKDKQLPMGQFDYETLRILGINL